MESKFEVGQMIKMKLEDGGYKYNYIGGYYFDEALDCYVYCVEEIPHEYKYCEDQLEPVDPNEQLEIDALAVAELLTMDLSGWLAPAKPKLIQSCKDPKTIYIEIDDIRWIFRNGEFDGWYRP